MDDFVFTTGHSTRSAAEFLELLHRHGVTCVVDVRAHPGSRRLPHFGQDALARWLREDDIDYRHMPDLGGRRRVDPAAPDAWGGAWRNQSFRAYAQYVQSRQYRDALSELITLASGQRASLMCSEAVPWRCHRWLVSDTLVARGVEVRHIIAPGPARRHVMSSFARTDGEQVSWPGPESSAPLSMGPALAVTW